MPLYNLISVDAYVAKANLLQAFLIEENPKLKAQLERGFESKVRKPRPLCSCVLLRCSAFRRCGTFDRGREGRGLLQMWRRMAHQRCNISHVVCLVSRYGLAVWMDERGSRRSICVFLLIICLLILFVVCKPNFVFAVWALLILVRAYWLPSKHIWYNTSSDYENSWHVRNLVTATTLQNIITSNNLSPNVS